MSGTKGGEVIGPSGRGWLAPPLAVSPGAVPSAKSEVIRTPHALSHLLVRVPKGVVAVASAGAGIGMCQEVINRTLSNLAIPVLAEAGCASCVCISVGRNPGAALITRGFPGVEGPRGFPRGLPGRVC